MSTNGQLETGPTFYELEHGHGQVLRMLKLASTNEIPGFVATDQSQTWKLTSSSPLNHRLLLAIKYSRQTIYLFFVKSFDERHDKSQRHLFHHF